MWFNVCFSAYCKVKNICTDFQLLSLNFCAFNRGCYSDDCPLHIICKETKLFHTYDSNSNHRPTRFFVCKLDSKSLGSYIFTKKDYLHLYLPRLFCYVEYSELYLMDVAHKTPIIQRYHHWYLKIKLKSSTLQPFWGYRFIYTHTLRNEPQNRTQSFWSLLLFVWIQNAQTSCCKWPTPHSCANTDLLNVVLPLAGIIRTRLHTPRTELNTFWPNNRYHHNRYLITSTTHRTPHAYNTPCTIGWRMNALHKHALLRCKSWPHIWLSCGLSMT
jgi:hypothetical protein